MKWSAYSISSRANHSVNCFFQKTVQQIFSSIESMSINCLIASIGTRYSFRQNLIQIPFAKNVVYLNRLLINVMCIIQWSKLHARRMQSFKMNVCNLHLKSRKEKTKKPIRKAITMKLNCPWYEIEHLRLTQGIIQCNMFVVWLHSL